MVNINIDIPDELHKQVKQEALDKDITFKALAIIKLGAKK